MFVINEICCEAKFDLSSAREVSQILNYAKNLQHARIRVGKVGVRPSVCLSPLSPTVLKIES